MPHWKIKATVQGLIARLPYSRFWNEMFQTYVTRTLDLTTSCFEAKLGHCQQHLEALRQLRPNAADAFTALDVGTGWYPVVPIAFHLCGSKRVWTFDIA